MCPCRHVTIITYSVILSEAKDPRILFEVAMNSKENNLLLTGLP